VPTYVPTYVPTLYLPMCRTVYIPMCLPCTYPCAELCTYLCSYLYTYHVPTQYAYVPVYLPWCLPCTYLSTMCLYKYLPRYYLGTYRVPTYVGNLTHVFAAKWGQRVFRCPKMSEKVNLGKGYVAVASCMPLSPTYISLIKTCVVFIYFSHICLLCWTKLNHFYSVAR
jgi:hypothetical protein